MTTDFAPETLELAADMMTGQLRDLVLDHMRDGKQTLPWNLLSEDIQKQTISTVEQSVRHAVSQAVQIIARDGKHAIDCHVEQIVIKDGIKIVLTAARTPANLIHVGDKVGTIVLMTSADSDPYAGSQERLPDPLQQDMFGGKDEDEGPVFDGTPSGRQ